MIVLETQRLILRTWLISDIEPYYLINQDAKVIEFLRGSLSREQVRDFIATANKHQQQHGYTLWAVELKKTAELIGYIGLNPIDWQVPFRPTVEIAWRLDSHYWNQGYATEGAKAALAYGFNRVKLEEIVSFTVPANKRSIRVMEKIGLIRDEHGDFAHPKLAPDHPLSPHILYRLNKTDFCEIGSTNNI